MVSITKKMLLACLLAGLGSCRLSAMVPVWLAAQDRTPMPAGVDINAQNDLGQTALFILISEADLDAVKRLVAEPRPGEPTINTNLVDSHHRTALMHAINMASDLFLHDLATGEFALGNRYLEFAIYLAQHTTNINQSQDGGFTALVLAVDVAAKLSTAKRSAPADNPALTAAIQTMEISTQNLIAQLLAHGASLGRITTLNTTPLIYAIQYGVSLAIVQQLINASSREVINMGNGDNETALYRVAASAAFSGTYTPAERLQMVRALIAKGADVNLFARGGWENSLMAAVRNNDTAIVNELIAHGANVEATNSSGQTALTIAAANPAMTGILAAEVKRVHAAARSTTPPVASTTSSTLPSAGSVPSGSSIPPAATATVTGAPRTVTSASSTALPAVSPASSSAASVGSAVASVSSSAPAGPVAATGAPLPAVSAVAPKALTLVEVTRALATQIKLEKQLQASLKKEQARLKTLQANLKKSMALRSKQQKAFNEKKATPAQKRKIDGQLKKTIKQIDQLKLSVNGAQKIIAKKKMELNVAIALKNKLTKQKAVLEKQARAKKITKKAAAKKIAAKKAKK